MKMVRNIVMFIVPIHVNWQFMDDKMKVKMAFIPFHFVIDLSKLICFTIHQTKSDRMWRKTWIKKFRCVCVYVRINTIKHSLVPSCTIQFTDVDCSIRFCHAQPYKSKTSNYPHKSRNCKYSFIFCEHKNANGVSLEQCKSTQNTREKECTKVNCLHSI